MERLFCNFAIRSVPQRRWRFIMRNVSFHNKFQIASLNHSNQTAPILHPMSQKHKILNAIDKAGSHTEKFNGICDSIKTNENLLTKNNDVASRVVGICNIASTVAFACPPPVGPAAGAICTCASFVSSFFVKQEDVPTTEEIISAKIDESTKELKEHFDAGFGKLAEQMKNMEIAIRGDIAEVKKGITELKAIILDNKIQKFESHLSDAAYYLFNSDYFAGEYMLRGDKKEEVLAHLKVGKTYLEQLTLSIEPYTEVVMECQYSTKVMVHGRYVSRPTEKQKEDRNTAIKIQDHLLTLYCTMAVFQITLYLLVNSQFKVIYQNEPGRLYDGTVKWIQETAIKLVRKSLTARQCSYGNILNNPCVLRFANGICLEGQELTLEKCHPKFRYSLKGKAVSTKNKEYPLSFDIHITNDDEIYGKMYQHHEERHTELLHNFLCESFGVKLDDLKQGMGLDYTRKRERHLANCWELIMKELKSADIPNEPTGPGEYNRQKNEIKFAVVRNGVQYQYIGTFDANRTITGTWTSTERDLRMFYIDCSDKPMCYQCDCFGCPGCYQWKQENETMQEKALSPMAADSGTFTFTISRNWKNGDFDWKVKQFTGDWCLNWEKP